MFRLNNDNTPSKMPGLMTNTMKENLNQKKAVFSNIGQTKLDYGFNSMPNRGASSINMNLSMPKKPTQKQEPAQKPKQEPTQKPKQEPAQKPKQELKQESIQIIIEEAVVEEEKEEKEEEVEEPVVEKKKSRFAAFYK